MRRNLGTMAVIGTAVAVTVMIVVAVTGIADGGPDRASRSPAVATAAPEQAVATATPTPTAPASSPPPVASSQVQPAPEADVSLVDLDGDVSQVPQALRAFDGLSGLQASPDGQRLAFSHGGRIYVASIDGRRILPVTSSDSAVSPAWSPDGRRLVFVAGSLIRIVDVGSRRVTTLLSPGEPVLRPTFGPDGRTILYTAPKGHRLWLWEVPVEGGQATPMHAGAFGVYSPDGDRIAFRATSYDGVDPTQMTASWVLIADASGQRVRRGGPGGGWMSQGYPSALWPSWSPDGSLIAYQRLLGFPVWVVDATEGKIVRSIDSGSIGDSSPTWLDDDTLIIHDDDPQR